MQSHKTRRLAELANNLQAKVGSSPVSIDAQNWGSRRLKSPNSASNLEGTRKFVNYGHCRSRYLRKLKGLPNRNSRFADTQQTPSQMPELASAQVLKRFLIHSFSRTFLSAKHIFIIPRPNLRPCRNSLQAQIHRSPQDRFQHILGQSQHQQYPNPRLPSQGCKP